MKRSIFIIQSLFLPLLLSAQVLKERRVYYLDCSYSMVKPNKIWGEVRDNLKNAIDNVSEETTELMVIPFAFDMQHHHSLNSISGYATPEGKAMIKKKIDGLTTTPNTMTFHCDPLNDFYTNRVAHDKVTYMFFMTDGEDEDSNHNTVKNLLPQWGKRYGNKNVFGFYVILHDSAKNKNVEKIIGEQEHLWKVETADVNINLIRLQNHAVFNVRNDKYFDLPIYGNANNVKFNASFPSSSPLQVESISVKGNHLRINVSCKQNIHQLPVSSDYPLNISVTGLGKYDFLVTDKVMVNCVSKPERSLKILVR